MYLQCTFFFFYKYWRIWYKENSKVIQVYYKAGQKSVCNLRSIRIGIKKKCELMCALYTDLHASEFRSNRWSAIDNWNLLHNCIKQCLITREHQQNCEIHLKELTFWFCVENLSFSRGQPDRFINIFKVCIFIVEFLSQQCSTMDSLDINLFSSGPYAGYDEI